jgi:hypothetical protein
MTAMPLTLACADYARLMPFVTGAVKPDGIALNLVHGAGE